MCELVAESSAQNIIKLLNQQERIHYMLLIATPWRSNNSY